jgi:hypothetical protein
MGLIHPQFTNKIFLLFKFPLYLVYLLPEPPILLFAQFFDLLVAGNLLLEELIPFFENLGPVYSFLDEALQPLLLACQRLHIAFPLLDVF